MDPSKGILAIDFRGVPARTINGKPGTLADSNQRLSKGFVPSFATELMWGKVRVAKFRRDWISVESDLENPRDPKGSYAFAPHFARTLTDLNDYPPVPIADHSPIKKNSYAQSTARWVPFVAYGLTGAISFSVITGSNHFTSDVFFGGAMGFIIARYAVLPPR